MRRCIERSTRLVFAMSAPCASTCSSPANRKASSIASLWTLSLDMQYTTLHPWIQSELRETRQTRHKKILVLALGFTITCALFRMLQASLGGKMQLSHHWHTTLEHSWHASLCFFFFLPLSLVTTVRLSSTERTLSYKQAVQHCDSSICLHCSLVHMIFRFC